MHPARFMPRFRRARRVVAELEQVEQWSRGDIERLQLNRINAIWRHAIAHVPYYRHLKVSADLPEQFCDLEQFKAQVPVLQKDTVRSGGDDFLSERAGPGKWYCTGGSTGTPMRLGRRSSALVGRSRLHRAAGRDGLRSAAQPEAVLGVRA